MGKKGMCMCVYIESARERGAGEREIARESERERDRLEGRRAEKVSTIGAASQYADGGPPVLAVLFLKY